MANVEKKNIFRRKAFIIAVKHIRSFLGESGANNSFLTAISCCEHYFMRTWHGQEWTDWQLIVRSTTLYNRARNHTGWQTSNRQQMDGYAWTKRRIVARANSVDFQLVHRESVCLFNRKHGCTYRRVVRYPLRTLASDGFYIRDIKRGDKQGR